jgi:hypothetical protein
MFGLKRLASTAGEPPRKPVLAVCTAASITGAHADARLASDTTIRIWSFMSKGAERVGP